MKGLIQVLFLDILKARFNPQKFVVPNNAFIEKLEWNIGVIGFLN
jgi:hypothetical protein